jgi:uncharacterized protein involved in high-affinity Fe2+ transport
MFKKLVASATFVSLAVSHVMAGEAPIGEPIEKNGMEIAAVYLQAVKMEPMMPMNMRADIHLEADIHALKGNQNGFGEGEWIPYLEISYQISKVGSDWVKIGAFMPMVASDGPHYGANIALDGAGKYKVMYQINPPPYRGLYRHIDKETGVGKWWKPFTTEWSFKYIGTGKKGGY